MPRGHRRCSRRRSPCGERWGTRVGVAAALAHLGCLAGEQADYERAALLYREGVAMLRTAVDRPVAAACLEGWPQSR